VWLIVAGVQAPPIVWHAAQVLAFIGALACVPGRPALGVGSPATPWQPDWVQVVDEVTPW